MSKGTDRDIVKQWISSLIQIEVLLEDINYNLFWPYIFTAPTDQPVAVGGTCTFTVEAANVTSYQWRVATPDIPWTDIPGATSASYSFTVTSDDYENFYQCKMIGKVSDAVSYTDMVTVLPLTT